MRGFGPYSLSPDYIPRTTSSPVDERIAGVLNDLQILAMIRMPDPQTPASALVLRVLLVGFRTMWPLAWSWVQFLDPLSDGPRSDGVTRLVISATIPSVLAMGLRLAMKETENRAEIVASMRDEPLKKLVALWYHDFGIDHSDPAMQKDLERDNDQGLCLQIRHAQGAISEIIADSGSEYYDSMVRALYKISGGHPGRLRRRMLANLERGLHSRQRLSEMDVAQLYLAPISYLLSIPSYTFPPLSSRTIRRQAELFLELSLSPDSAPRAVGMCSVISSLHRKELSGRVMAMSIPSGLLTGLRNIIAQQPVVRALREGDGAKVVMALIITLIVTLRLRRVARSFVHTDVVPLSREEMLEPKSLLVNRWENLMGRKRLHAQAWAAHKERLKHARRCFNAKCTARPVLVRRCICQESYYCSKECQRMDWRLQHRLDCVGERTGCDLDLTLEDRIFLEELTRCYVNGSHSLLCREIATYRRHIRDGCHIAIRVLYNKHTPQVEFLVDPIVQTAGETRDPRTLLIIIAEFAYFETKATLTLQPFPLHEYTEMVPVG